MSAHKWQFSARFRRHAFGWRSDTPIQRIKEALAEIKLVARKEPVVAAEGAVTLLEKLSPALEQVDSSSGSLGSAVNRAIDTLVPIIAKANVEPDVRQQWLERLWQALENDGIPYLELLGEYWGELCATPEMAAKWADKFLPLVEYIWVPQESGRGFFKGTIACLASFYAAGRHEQLLTLLGRAPFRWWHYHQWGVKALVAMGKKVEAVRYAEQLRGVNDPGWQIAESCEAILLSSGMAEEAYRRYALEANRGATNLATFRAIVRKYPNVAPEQILRDLINSTPGAEGKWFAAAKDAGLFGVAIELANNSPTDPRTLVRAARDFAVSQPEFAVASGLAALRWLALGHGYDITVLDVLDAYSTVLHAAEKAGRDIQQVKGQIVDLLSGTPVGKQFLKTVLSHPQ